MKHKLYEINNGSIDFSEWNVKKNGKEEVITKLMKNLAQEDLVIDALYKKNRREAMHCKRVSKLCKKFSIYLGMNEEKIEIARVAGLMHDIGKISVNEKILNKKGKLTDVEWIRIKKHPETGYEILKHLDKFSEIAKFVLEHQERWDGTGYPKGLKGEDITLEGRIIAIADAYDAMTSVRTYGHVFKKAEALEEIRKCSGTYFDPRLANIFIKMIESQNYVK